VKVCVRVGGVGAGCAIHNVLAWSYASTAVRAVWCVCVFACAYVFSLLMCARCVCVCGWKRPRPYSTCCRPAPPWLVAWLRGWVAAKRQVL
jgi:hypothetical protein